jgi:hypothetical protein
MKARAANENILASGEASDAGGLGAAPPAEGPWTDLVLHALAGERFKIFARRPMRRFSLSCGVFREARDGGQDLVFLIPLVTSSLTMKFFGVNHWIAIVYLRVPRFLRTPVPIVWDGSELDGRMSSRGRLARFRRIVFRR